MERGEGFQGLLAIIQECDTTSTLLGMCDTHCSVGGAGKQMTKLDEESDLGYMDQPLGIGETAISALWQSKHNPCELNQRITNSMNSEKSSDLMVSVANVVTCLQGSGVTQDQSDHIPDHNVKENKVYIPPHRRSNQDW